MKLYIENQDHETFVETDSYVHYVYAHYELGWEVGFDLVCCNESDNFDYVNDRIEDTIAVLPNGKEIEAVLYFWHSPAQDEEEERYYKTRPTSNCHGLLVAKTDKEGNKDAFEKFNKKTSMI